MAKKSKEVGKSKSKDARVETAPIVTDLALDHNSDTEIEELLAQLDKLKFEGEFLDVYRSEWTIEEDMFILKNLEVKKNGTKRAERLYESERNLRPKSFTKNVSHEDLSQRYEELKSPLLSERRSLILRLVQSRCTSEDVAAATIEADSNREKEEEERRQSSGSTPATIAARRRPSETLIAELPSGEDMVDVLVLDEIRCPIRFAVGRLALRSSPILRGKLHAAPPPRPPDYRPEIVLDAAASEFDELRPYNVVQVSPFHTSFVALDHVSFSSPPTGPSRGGTSRNLGEAQRCGSLP
jgi:hypothetical protein